jgi:hypothetical protein
MLLLGLLAAMMLVTSPVLSHQGGGPNHGDKYWKNYYPNSYFNYCEPDGDRFFGDRKSSNDFWCHTYYTEYKTKWNNGKKYYYVHVYYEWRTPDRNFHKKDYWYYSQYEKWNDPDSSRPYFKAWVGYKPTGDHYWESFYYVNSPSLQQQPSSPSGPPARAATQ